MVAGAQVEPADLRRADVGVVRAGQVAGLGRAEEAEAVRQDLQHAVGLHAFAVAGQHLQDREDDVLLAGAGHALADLQLVGDLQQLVRGHALEVAQRVGGEAFRHLRVRARHEVLAVAALVGHAAVALAFALALAAVLEAFATAVAVAAIALLAAVVAILLAAFATVAAGLRSVAVFGLGAGVGRCSRGRRRCSRCRGRSCRRRRVGQRHLGLFGAARLGHAGLAHALLGDFAGVVGGVGQGGTSLALRAPAERGSSGRDQAGRADQKGAARRRWCRTMPDAGNASTGAAWRASGPFSGASVGAPRRCGVPAVPGRPPGGFRPPCRSSAPAGPCPRRRSGWPAPGRP